MSSFDVLRAFLGSRQSQAHAETSARSRARQERFYIGRPYADSYLTTREAQVVVHFLMGKTIDATAVSLQLSPRTIEFYVRNMKFKLQCRTKAELIKMIKESEFMQSLVHVMTANETIV